MFRGEPGEAAHHGSSQLSTFHAQCWSAPRTRPALLRRHDLQSSSLSFFIAKHFTVFDAGFALKTHGSLVKGLIPLRAFVAGLFFSFMFSIPPSLKEPDFFTCSTAPM